MLTRPLVTIYALGDPRSGLVRYVGQTVNLQARTEKHVGGRTDQRNPELRGWLAELRRAGLEPQVRVLEECRTPGVADAQEKHWIRKFIAEGLDLLNRCDGGTRGITPALHAGRDRWLQVAVDLRAVRADGARVRDALAETMGGSKPTTVRMNAALNALDQARDSLCETLQVLFPEWSEDLISSLYE